MEMASRTESVGPLETWMMVKIEDRGGTRWRYQQRHRIAEGGPLKQRLRRWTNLPSSNGSASGFHVMIVY